MLSTINEPIHIVEPTLRDEAGHCHSLIANLAACQNRPPLVVWGDQLIHLPQLTSLPGLKLQAYFSRRMRRVQAFFCIAACSNNRGKYLSVLPGVPICN